MNLGERIYELRIQAHLSQGDLAEALEVSRQSVSKWENGNAVPDLDKLVKLSKLFGITLDELVTGASPIPQPAPETAIPPQVPQRPNRIAGWVLFVGGLAVFLVLSLMGGIAVGLLFSAPLLVPGIICLTAKRQLGLKCAWAEFFMVTAFLIYGTGTNWNTMFAWLRHWDTFMEHGNIGHFLISFAEFFLLVLLMIWTVRSYNKDFRPLTRRGKILLAIGWAVYFLMKLPFRLPIDIFSVWYSLAANAINWSRLGLLTILLVFSDRLYLQLRKKKV